MINQERSLIDILTINGGNLTVYQTDTGIGVATINRHPMVSGDGDNILSALIQAATMLKSYMTSGIEKHGALKTRFIKYEQRYSPLNPRDPTVREMSALLRSISAYRLYQDGNEVCISTVENIRIDAKADSYFQVLHKALVAVKGITFGYKYLYIRERNLISAYESLHGKIE